MDGAQAFGSGEVDVVDEANHYNLLALVVLAGDRLPVTRSTGCIVI